MAPLPSPGEVTPEGSPTRDLVSGLSPRRRALLAFFSVLLSGLVSLAGAEIFLRWNDRRVAAAAARTEGYAILYESSPAVPGPPRLEPGVEVSFTLRGRPMTIRTNSRGMRWREVAAAKPAGRKRVAFLGDSFTFGCWADRIEDSFVGVFERNVSQRKLEVLNLGVPGHGTEDSEWMLEHEALALQADYAVLMFYAGNDFRDVFLGRDRWDTSDGTARLRPLVVEQRVPEPYRTGPHATSQALRGSRTERWLRGFALVRHTQALLGLEPLAVDFRPSERFTSYSFWSRHPYPEIARDARDRTLASIGRMQELAARAGLRFGVVAIPTRDQVYSRRTSGPDFDVAFPQVYVQVFARERGIPYLDLLPVLREHLARRSEPLYVDTHFNNRGHELVGLELADWFRCCLKEAPEGEAAAQAR